MAKTTKIQWTHHTFNPWRGCTEVSPGCAHCYAEAMSVRNPKVLGIWGDKGTRVIASESYWRQPLKWDREAKAAGVRRRVFCASLADIFEDRPELEAPRKRLFDLITATKHLDWLLLTKRPENVLGMTYDAWCVKVPGHVSQNAGDGRHWRWPPNVWLGVSVENQARADERIPLLLQTPAAVRFLSCEPLLGPVDLTWVGRSEHHAYTRWNCLTGEAYAVASGTESAWDTIHPNGSGPIGWVIVGGESGPGARPFDLAWGRSLVQQCATAGVVCFVKQLGARANTGPYDAEEGCFPRCWRCGHFDFGPCSDGTLLCNGCDAPWDRLRDKKGGDPEEWPIDLRVRQVPEVVR